MRSNRSRAHGVGLAIAILLLALITVLSLTLGALGIQNLNTVKNYNSTISARYAALAGLNKCSAMLYDTPSWSAGFPDSALDSAVGSYYVTFDKSKPYYSVNNFDGAMSAVGYGGVSVPPGFAHVISSGTVISNVQRVVGMIRKPVLGPDWKYAVFADRSMEFKGGGNTKSFDSSIGSYPYTVDSSGGDIGTNGTDSGVVHFAGAASVYGDILVGPGGNVGTSIDPPGGAGHILGGGDADVSATAQTLPMMSDFVLSTSLGDRRYSGGGDYGTLPPGKYDDLIITGKGTLHLTAGYYSFRRITQAATATLQVDVQGADDKVRIYVRGTPETNDIDIDISGGGVQNGSYKPTRCLIYGGPWVTSVRYTGSSQGYWAMYAPKADAVQSGTQDVWGGVICKTYTQTGSAAVKSDRAVKKRKDTGSGIFPQITSIQYLDRTQ